QRLDVGALVMPKPEPGHSEPMPEIVWSHWLAIVKTGELSGLCKVALQAGRRETTASRAEKEARVRGTGKRGVALTGISTQSGVRRWVNRNQAILTKLGLADENDPTGQIDVAAIQPDHFARSQPGARKQSDQRRHRATNERQPWRNEAACVDE